MTVLFYDDKAYLYVLLLLIVDLFDYKVLQFNKIMSDMPKVAELLVSLLIPSTLGCCILNVFVIFTKCLIIS